MTQSQIDAIKEASMYRHIELPKEQEAQRKAAEAKCNELESKCDHKYPDGSSAIQSSIFMNTCKICGWNDF